MSGPPHKWTKYKAMKDVVKGTRFLPFKTPYKEPVRGERFTAEVLMQRVANLGFVLNLVKTDRYYNPSAYQRYHIRTFHVKLEGHGETPKPEEINKIFNTLKQYMMMEKDPTKLIGVHCTHGVNRTGYVICRYMIEKLGMKPQDAMDNFRDARGYPFDHEEYEEALRTLTPSIDEEAEAFHKIGGKIIPRSEELEPELDVDQALLKRRGARQRRMASIGEDANGDDDRRQTRDDQRDNDRRDHDRHRGGRDSERHVGEARRLKKRLKDRLRKEKKRQMRTENEGHEQDDVERRTLENAVAVPGAENSSVVETTDESISSTVSHDLLGTLQATAEQSTTVEAVGRRATEDVEHVKLDIPEGTLETLKIDKETTKVEQARASGW